MKKLFALLLALLLLTGCAVAPGGMEPLESGQTDSTGIKLPTMPSRPRPTKPDANVLFQVLPKTVDNPDNLPVLKWVCLTDCIGGWERTWSEDAIIELNQMLAHRNLPFRLQLLIYSYDSPITEIGVFFDEPEVQDALQEADIIYGFMSADDARNLLMPITKYVTGDVEPSLKNTVPSECYWRYVTLNGEIYGVPTMRGYPAAPGWFVNKDLMQELGLTDVDFQRNFWEMDEVFAKIFVAKGGRFLHGGVDGYGMYDDFTTMLSNHTPTALSQALNSYYIGCGLVFGIDPVSNEIVNVLDTEYCRKVQQAVSRYTKAGYYTNGSSKRLIHYGIINTHRAEDSQNKENFRLIPIRTPASNVNNVVSPVRMNGVAKNSQYKEEALTLLKLLAEDKALMMQFAYGKEGRDYTIDDDGAYHMVKHEDGTNYSMSHLAIMSGFTHIRTTEGIASAVNPGAYIENDVIFKGMTRLESHREIWNNTKKAYVIPFDYSEFEAEVAAVESVCSKYFGSFSMLTPERYDKMIADFNAAGAEKILASLQKQYDQWKKDNPDKVN